MPERYVSPICQIAMFMVAALVLVTGFWRVSDMELNEAQVLLAFGIIFVLTMQCVTLGVLMDFARRHTKRDE
jgi:hypothetical protein